MKRFVSEIAAGLLLATAAPQAGHAAAGHRTDARMRHAVLAAVARHERQMQTSSTVSGGTSHNAMADLRQPLIDHMADLGLPHRIT